MKAIQQAGKIFMEWVGNLVVSTGLSTKVEIEFYIRKLPPVFIFKSSYRTLELTKKRAVQTAFF